MIDADWNRKAGEGTHATLSPFDIHNLLIAAGPHLHRGMSDQLATANVDLAPTILHILGMGQTVKMDGRELTEAFADGGISKYENSQFQSSAVANG